MEMKHKSSIEIGVKITGGRSAAMRALQFVNWYLQDHAGIIPVITRHQDPDCADPYYQIVLGEENGLLFSLSENRG